MTFALCAARVFRLVDCSLPWPFDFCRVQAMPSPNLPAPEEACAAAVAVASAEEDTLASNDSLESGASTKPDEGLKPDDMLQ